MIISVTGTRNGMTDEQACIFEGLMPRMAEFHHGSCEGVDVQAAIIVDKMFLPVARPKIISHPGPDDDPHRALSGVDDVILPGKTHFARNRDLVNICDVLYALPGENWEKGQVPRRGGTAYTVTYARKIGKQVTIIYPNGGIE